MMMHRANANKSMGCKFHETTLEFQKQIGNSKYFSLEYLKTCKRNTYRK